MNSTVFDLTPWRRKLVTTNIQCVMAEKTVMSATVIVKKMKNEWQPFKSWVFRRLLSLLNSSSKGVIDL